MINRKLHSKVAITISNIKLCISIFPKLQLGFKTLSIKRTKYFYYYIFRQYFYLYQKLRTKVYKCNKVSFRSII